MTPDEIDHETVVIAPTVYVAHSAGYRRNVITRDYDLLGRRIRRVVAVGMSKSAARAVVHLPAFWARWGAFGLEEPEIVCVPI